LFDLSWLVPAVVEPYFVPCETSEDSGLVKKNFLFELKSREV